MLNSVDNTLLPKDNINPYNPELASKLLLQAVDNLSNAMDGTRAIASMKISVPIEARALEWAIGYLLVGLGDAFDAVEIARQSLLNDEQRLFLADTAHMDKPRYMEKSV